MTAEVRDLPDLTAAELHAKLVAGEVSAVEATQAALDRIHAAEPRLHAFLAVTADQALADASAVDAARTAGQELGPLAGVPLALKDVLVTRGTETTAGSKILSGYEPPYDATVVTRLREAGAILVGKTNMDEFAMGSSTENSGFGPTGNPWDPDRVPGGSSGGSAAAVAAGMATVGIGTDTGGSIRQPAALCGLVGVKPTYGLVSRFGLIAFASSLDQAGPFARDVRDAAELLQVIAGHDPLDSTSIAQPAPDLVSELDRGIEGMRLGVVAEFAREGVQAGVRARIDEAVNRLDKLGAEIVEVSMPSFEYALSAYYLIAPAECSSNLARFDGVRWGLRTPGARDVVEMMTSTRSTGFGPEVKRRIMLGTYALSAGYYDAYYGQAQKVRTLVARDLERAWSEQGIDLLVGPTSPTTAFKLGERVDDPLAMYLSDVFTIPVNLAGTAAISVPAGLADEDQLPVGLQLIAPVLGEAAMFRAAYAFEQDLGFDNRPSQLLSRFTTPEVTS